jgi:hypothetical protein
VRIRTDGVVFARRLFDEPLMILFLDFFLFFTENVSAALGIDASATCYSDAAKFSQSSSTFTISDISQSAGVTPAAIAGVIFKV